MDEELVFTGVDLNGRGISMGIFPYERRWEEVCTYLVPACLSHTIDILLMRSTTTVHDTIAITIAIADAGTPFARDV